MRLLLSRIFPVGTRSVLFGVHNPLWHGPTVWAGYYQLYGRDAFSLPVIAACFLHDIGYFGKPNMDGPEGDEHPTLGANVMHYLFDDPYIDHQWSGRWHDFTLYHSRHFAKKAGRPYSRLAVADKLAIALTPWWFYLPLATLSGEIKGYMAMAKVQVRVGEAVNTSERAGLMSASKRIWFSGLQTYMRRWCEAHKDGGADTWTSDRKVA